MSGGLWLENFGAWSLQIAALILAGGLLPWIARVRVAGLKLVYLQVLLVACLLLPILQPWQRLPASSGGSISLTSVSIASVPVEGAPAFDWTGAVLLLLAAATAFRLATLALGFGRLRVYRRGSEPLAPESSAFTALRSRIGVRAQILLSERIAGPVTFGFRKPVILLPVCFLEWDSHVQRAVLCHELLHVRRRDWLFTAVEESIRAVFWFHPAIWWLLAQIQLTREQAVDREVVSCMESDFSKARAQYLEALLAIAGAKAQLDLAPAPLFLKKRHLTERVAHLLKEFSMSKQRMIASFLAFFGMLLMTGWLAVRSFPLQGAPQVSVQQGDSNLLHRAPVEYPAEAREKRIEGQVVLAVSIDEKGNVSDAYVITGPEELRKAALQSVLLWHYSPGQMTLPAKTQVTIDFRLPDKETPQRPEFLSRLTPEPARQLGSLKRIDVAGLAEPAKAVLLNRLALREGDGITTENIQRIRQIARETDEHLTVGYRLDASDHSVVVVIALRERNPATLEDSAKAEALLRQMQEKMEREKMAAPASATGVTPQRIRVGGNVQAMNLIKQPRPVYPPLAKQTRVQGVVRLIAIIGRDGTVQNLEVESGHPLLVPAALEAVKEWVYKPTLLNGEPVEVTTQIDVNFTLSE